MAYKVDSDKTVHTSGHTAGFGCRKRETTPAKSACSARIRREVSKRVAALEFRVFLEDDFVDASVRRGGDLDVDLLDLKLTEQVILGDLTPLADVPLEDESRDGVGVGSALELRAKTASVETTRTARAGDERRERVGRAPYLRSSAGNRRSALGNDRVDFVFGDQRDVAGDRPLERRRRRGVLEGSRDVLAVETAGDERASKGVAGTDL